jgi:hypothetical protein
LKGCQAEGDNLLSTEPRIGLVSELEKVPHNSYILTVEPKEGLFSRLKRVLETAVTHKLQSQG